MSTTPTCSFFCFLCRRRRRRESDPPRTGYLQYIYKEPALNISTTSRRQNVWLKVNKFLILISFRLCLKCIMIHLLDRHWVGTLHSVSRREDKAGSFQESFMPILPFPFKPDRLLIIEQFLFRERCHKVWHKNKRKKEKRRTKTKAIFNSRVYRKNLTTSHQKIYDSRKNQKNY